MSHLSIKERKSKFNKLSSSLNIKLKKGDKKYIQHILDYINKGKKLKKNLLVHIIKANAWLIVVNYLLEYYLIVDT